MAASASAHTSAAAARRMGHHEFGFLPRRAASAHSEPSRDVHRNAGNGEPVVTGFSLGRAEDQTVALVGVVLVGIAIR